MATDGSELIKHSTDADRWIVKERDDGTNCNNWHWSERDLTGWAKERLESLLGKMTLLDDATGKCTITSLESMSGTVTVQSRKKKKFALYELELVLKWEGQLFGSDGATLADATGKVKIPDLSEETYDDLEMTVECEEETSAKRPLKEHVRKQGAKLISEACMSFVKELKAAVDAERAGDGPPLKAAPKPTERVNSSYVVGAEKSKGTSKITIKYDFSPPPPLIYETLLSADRLRGITASDATMSSEVGAEFKLFSGAVEGKVLELQPFDGESATLKWRWRFNSWGQGVHSTVTIVLKLKDGSTKLELTQVGVPEEEKERTEKGWTNLMFDRMKAMLGGSVMG